MKTAFQLYITHAKVILDRQVWNWHTALILISTRDCDIWQWHKAARLIYESLIWHWKSRVMLICDNHTYLTSGFCRTFTVTGLEDWSSLFISWTLKSLPKRKRSICKTRPVEFKYRKNYLSLYWSQVTHPAGVYPCFCSMKRLEL